MDVKPIRTDDDYRAAMRQVSAYFDDEPDPGSEAGEHFEALLALVQAYEAAGYPVLPPAPIVAINS